MEVKVWNFGSIAQSLPMLHPKGEKILTVQVGGFVVVEQEDILYNEQQMAEKGLSILGGSPAIPKAPVPVPTVEVQAEVAEVKLETPEVKVVEVDKPEIKLETLVASQTSQQQQTPSPANQNKHQQKH